MVKRKEHFNQVAVLQGVLMNNGRELEKFFTETFGIRTQFLETVITLPDKDASGNNVPDTGGRSDVLFAIHDEDVMKFAVPRFSIGARWIEDCVSDINNPNGIIYDKEVLDYVTWNEENIST